MVSIRHLATLMLGICTFVLYNHAGPAHSQEVSAPLDTRTEADILELLKKISTFSNLSDLKEFVQEDKQTPATNDIVYPQVMSYPSQINSAISKLKIDRVKDFVTKFSGFHNRFYNSSTGIASSDWLFEQVKIVTEPYLGKVKVKQVQHGFPQKSIIAKVFGTDPALKHEVIIIGAHLDSINISEMEFGRSPGADDDGSGCGANLEVLRILMQLNILPKRTIEFHWYAGEEPGLKGSMDIAKFYRDNNVNVYSMINYDMLGHLSKNNLIGLVKDYTNEKLTDFLKIVIDSYSKYGHTEIISGGPGSDYASWSAFGYPAATPSEDKKNPHAHKESDTVENMNFDHVSEFIKISIASVIELSGISV